MALLLRREMREQSLFVIMPIGRQDIHMHLRLKDIVNHMVLLCYCSRPLAIPIAAQRLWMTRAVEGMLYYFIKQLCGLLEGSRFTLGHQRLILPRFCTFHPRCLVQPCRQPFLIACRKGKPLDVAPQIIHCNACHNALLLLLLPAKTRLFFDSPSRNDKKEGINKKSPANVQCFPAVVRIEG